MKSQQHTLEEQCQDTFRITQPDQSGGIFSHDDKAVIIKRKDAHVTDILSPIATDDAAGNES